MLTENARLPSGEDARSTLKNKADALRGSDERQVLSVDLPADDHSARAGPPDQIDRVPDHECGCRLDEIDGEQERQEDRRTERTSDRGASLSMGVAGDIQDPDPEARDDRRTTDQPRQRGRMDIEFGHASDEHEGASEGHHDAADGM